MPFANSESFQAASVTAVPTPRTSPPASTASTLRWVALVAMSLPPQEFVSRANACVPVAPQRPRICAFAPSSRCLIRRTRRFRARDSLIPRRIDSLPAVPYRDRRAGTPPRTRRASAAISAAMVSSRSERRFHCCQNSCTRRVGPPRGTSPLDSCSRGTIPQPRPSVTARA
ncbi:hypothetical protein D514_0102805 [Microbacterium sp. UCD-TDU]|nr:hypothetical protein D514_0102805 [Microbacterium sp. UCD-TDU]